MKYIMHYKSVKYYSMKKLLYLFLAMFITIGLNACSPDDNPIDDSDTETPENPNPDEPVKNHLKNIHVSMS